MTTQYHATHTLRARSFVRAFARVRAFLERCTAVRGVTAGFGGTEVVTLDRLAADLAALDESDPMAGLNGYTWTLEADLLNPRTRVPVTGTTTSQVGLLAHAGRLQVTFRLAWPSDVRPDDILRFRAAVAETLGVTLAAKKFRCAASMKRRVRRPTA